LLQQLLSTEEDLLMNKNNTNLLQAEGNSSIMQDLLDENKKDNNCRSVPAVSKLTPFATDEI